MPDLAQTRNLIGRLLRDRRANFAVMTALSAPFAIALSAVAVDQGSLFVERRSAQALVDIAAITAATNLDKAEQAVLLTLKDNGIASAAIDSSGARPDEAKALVSVERGRYSMASALGARFQPGIQPYNAVRVSLRKIGALYFGGQFMAPPVIGTSAVASTSAQAAFSIGSRLLSVDTGNSPILNAVLGGLLGTNLSLGVMDYRALIRADVNILSFFDAMAVRLNMTGVSYDDVLAAKASVGQIARAMADVPGLDGGAKLALQAVAGKATGTAKVPLRQLVDLGDIGRLGVGQRLEGLSLDASAMSLLSAAAALANGTRQVDVNLGASIPGLLSTRLSVAIGEPPQHSPWLTIGEKGKVVRTAQLRLKLLVSLGIGAEPKPPGVKLLSVQLPLHVEVAHAEARLTDISCPTGRPESLKVSIAAQPGIATLHIADSAASGFADFTRPLSFQDATIANVSLKLLLVNLDLLAINGSAAVTVANMAATPLFFSHAEIAAKAIKSVSTRDITQSLTTSLIDDLSLSVDVAGLGINVAALLGPPKALLLPTLKAATQPVDTLLESVLGALGVRIGEADVRVTGAVCSRSVLVQ